MSEQTPATTTAPADGVVKDKQAGFQATERIEAPQGGPGRGPMGGGMVGQKAMTFVPSAKQTDRQDAPRPGDGGRWSSCSASAASC